MLMHESAWLRLPDIFFVLTYRQVYSLILLLVTSVLSQIASVGMFLSMCSLTFSGRVSFDLPSAHQLFFFFPSQSTIN